MVVHIKMKIITTGEENKQVQQKQTALDRTNIEKVKVSSLGPTRQKKQRETNTHGDENH